jgi:nitrogen fixation NifU-like protein
MYSKKVMEHFRNPQNHGTIENADGVGKVGNPVCGDVMHIYIKVEDNILRDVKFETFGCVAAIATSSMGTDLIKGKTVDEALEITNQAVTEALEGLPPAKLHCSVLVEEGIQAAIEDYKSRGKTQG